MLCLFKGLFPETHFASFVLRNFVLCVFLTLLRLRLAMKSGWRRIVGRTLPLQKVFLLFGKLTWRSVREASRIESKCMVVLTIVMVF
jgi:hypothetical protein